MIVGMMPPEQNELGARRPGREDAGQETSPPGERPRRGLIYLALAMVLAGFLVGTMIWPGPVSTAAPPCDGGTAIYRLSVERDPQGGSHLLAVVGPASGLNAVVGDAPGCQALYQSDDGGATWAAVFSHTSEGPVAVEGDASGHVYVFATTIRFPLYVAGNLYRDDDLRYPWIWQRVSPQQRNAIPSAAITGIALAPDGALLALVASGDGGALIRSADLGQSWQPIVVPRMLSVSGMAVLGSTIGVTPGSYAPGLSPGRTSLDGGRTWSDMGLLHEAPHRTGLVPVLTAEAGEGALVLDLMTGPVASGGVTVARFVSRDGGRSWNPDRCTALPTAGCAAVDLWSGNARVGYVLYRRQLFQNQADRGWHPVTTALPVAAGSIEQVVAGARGQGDAPYLVTRAAVWRLDERGAWVSITKSLPLLAPASPAYTSLPPGWPAAT